jgi:hypothetical protein
VDELSTNLRIWKHSHGGRSFEGKEQEREELKERLVITLFEDTAKGQGLAFRKRMRRGDFFYLCHGNKLVLFGQITSNIREASKKSWVEREYRVIKECSKRRSKFTGPQKKWTPNYNSTCAMVPTEELRQFERTILEPFFSLRLRDISKRIPEDSIALEENKALAVARKHKLSASDLRCLASAKANFTIASKRGTPPLRRDLFIIKNKKASYRPGITPWKALAIIRSELTYKHDPVVLQAKTRNIDKQLDRGAKKAAVALAQKLEGEIDKAAGFQPNSKIKKAIELHAMRRAVVEFRKRGYDVTDKSARQPYDYLCEKTNQTKYVEVKGAQGDGLAFVLTAGEVKFIKANQPKCILCVVHGITIKGKRSPKASGGSIAVVEPFDLKHGKLKPIAFSFRRRLSMQEAIVGEEL